MNKNMFLVGGLLTIVLAVVLFQNLQKGNSQQIREAEELTAASNTDESLQAREPLPNQEEAKSWYRDYSQQALAEVAAEGGSAVIFFHANWCPTCQAASRDFDANQDQIPSDVTIIKADYDTETQLKAKYGVVTQDTFVQVDANGEALSTWNSGGEGIKSLLANLK